MSVESIKNIELSSEELDVVAGGGSGDFLLDATNFNAKATLIAQQTTSGSGGSATASTVATEKINTNAFHSIFVV